MFFDPFYFKNGNKAKAKFFVVLNNDGINTIIGSLPTSRDAVPSEHNKKNGCIELPSINFNCFKISSSQIITTCGKRFKNPTFIYGYQLDDYQLDYIYEIYPNEGIDYYLWGKMKRSLFRDLIKCIKTSKSVKRKFKKRL